MATILSTKTSGVGGLTVTGDASGVLELASANGTTAVTIDASQNVTTSANLTYTGTLTGSTGILNIGSGQVYKDASGNVGIGTSSPNTILDVVGSGDTTLTIRGSGAYTGILNIQAGGGGSSRINATGGTGVLDFQTGSTNRMRIDASGNLLVGTTSSLSGVGSEFRGSVSQGGSGVLAAYNSLTSAADASPPLVVNKGMTTTTSSARFVQFYASAGAVPMGGIVGNGASNVQFAALSDSREKTNIQEISGSLTKVIALKPVEFDWIADNSHVNAGFIAQDVKEIFPDFVVDNMANDGQEQRYGLTGGMTGGIIPHLVKAIQEQQTLIEALTARLTALEAK